MTPGMRKRLERIEESFVPDERKNGVVFIPLKGESTEECADRMARWRAGEIVEGIDRRYTGREPVIGVVRFVREVK